MLGDKIMNVMIEVYKIMYLKEGNPFILISVYGVLLIGLNLIAFRIYKEKYVLTLKDKLFSILSGGTMMVIAGLFGKEQLVPLIVWIPLGLIIVIDMKYTDIPNRLNLFIGLMAIPTLMVTFNHANLLYSGFLTGITLFIIFFLILLFFSMGFGDVKMMLVLGFFMTFYEIPQLLIYGFGVATIHGIYALVVKKQKLKSQIPFGPALIIGTLLTVII